MIAEIEAGMAARVQAASDSGILGYTFATVCSYGRAHIEITAGILQYPAMWSIFAGDMQTTELGGGRYLTRPMFLAFVAAEAWLSVTFDRTKAATGLPGSYQLMLDVRRVLMGQTFGLDIDPMTPGRVTPVEVEQNVSVLSCEFTTSFEERALDWSDPTLDDFLRFRADYDFPVHGNVVPPMPAAEADARDAVDLPGPED